MNRIVETACTDPYRNLALEELLFSDAFDGMTFYLWQNARTVVIGRSQNALKECRIAALEADGGRLARRPTGGGAVYHDLGNLNFTFIAGEKQYDVARQLSVIQAAAAMHGVALLPSGRNDLVTPDGAKCSGSAFRRSKDRRMHHGTLLVDAELSVMGRYLSPPKAKLESKGVESVRARVENMKTYAPELTVRALADALRAAFIREYGAAESVPDTAFDVSALAAQYASSEWRIGAGCPANASAEGRFYFGSAELLLHIERGVIREAHFYTDALDPELPGRIEAALTGAPCAPDALKARVAGLPEQDAVLSLLGQVL